MPRLLPTRRGASSLTLKVRSADETATHEDPLDLPGPSLPWHVGGLLAGLGGALCGWLIVAGVLVAGWLLARTGGLPTVLAVATQVWVLTNGGGLVLDGQRLTLVPLGLTLVLATLTSGLVQGAARQAVLGDRARGISLTHGDRGRIARNVSVLATIAYAASVTLTASLVGTPNQGARALVGSVLVGALASWVGACRGTAYRVSAALPAWASPLPGAVRGGLATIMAGGAAAFATAVWLNRPQVEALYAAMAPDATSGAALTLLQLAYLPNLIGWSAAYALGAGFTLGEGSVISPASTDLGMIPGIPVFGALPIEGSGSAATLAWLVVGALAGIVAAAVVVRSRPRARFDESAVVGGVAGILLAGLFVGLAACCRGDLGNGRLVGLGPRLAELALLGGSVMGLAGMTAGLVLGLLRPPGGPGPAPVAVLDENEASGAVIATGEDEAPVQLPQAAAEEIGESSDEPTRRVLESDDEPTRPVPRAGDGPTAPLAPRRWWQRR